MLIKCEFEFDRTTPIFYSGDDVCGSAQILLSKPMKVQAIQIDFRGSALIRQNQCTSQFHSPVLQYNDSSSNEYFPHLFEKDKKYEKVFLHDCLHLTNYLELPIGQHQFKFHFHIPRDSPATLSHTHGNISYHTRIVLKRQTKHDKIFMRCVVVKPTLDLNADSSLKLSQSVSGEVFCKDNQTKCGTVTLELPHSGYVPGQNIYYALETDLVRTRRRNIDFLVQLRQAFVFRNDKFQIKQNSCSRTLAVKKRNLASINNNKDSQLRIPLMSPISTPKFEQRSAIEVAYFLEAIIRDRKKRVLLKLTLPLVVGTVALNGCAEKYAKENEYCYENLEMEY